MKKYVDWKSAGKAAAWLTRELVNGTRPDLLYLPFNAQLARAGFDLVPRDGFDFIVCEVLSLPGTSRLASKAERSRAKRLAVVGLFDLLRPFDPNEDLPYCVLPDGVSVEAALRGDWTARPAPKVAGGVQ